MSEHDTVRPVRWTPPALRLLDQRRLPDSVEYVDCFSAHQVADAIRDMVVRGAPAIGIAAAYGVVLAVRDALGRERARWRAALDRDLEWLARSRPTAVNLAWSLRRMSTALDHAAGDPATAAENEAEAIFREDLAANYRMGELGAAWVDGAEAVLTHCNTGSLATAGYGTALGVIRTAYKAGRIRRVYADETRPWLQGARLTAWELRQDGIPVTLIADSAAAPLMRTGAVKWIIVGADRITANGDVANKIGTYGLALAARIHGVRFMVVAPTATIDPALPHGDAIPIEDRGEDELLCINGRRIAPEGVDAWNPVFDVTPAEYVDVLVTERGAVERPDAAAIKALLRRGGGQQGS